MKFLLLLWSSAPLTWWYLLQNPEGEFSDAPFLALYSIFGAPYVFFFTTLALIGLGATKIMQGLSK